MPHLLFSQARFESQRIQLESELAVQLEQRVTERLVQAQESSLRQAASLREQHRYWGLTGCCCCVATAGAVSALPVSSRSLCYIPQHTAPSWTYISLWESCLQVHVESQSA